MMPEEIIALREEYWGRPGSQREKLVRALFNHIDEQASQIATLKAALIKERATEIIRSGRAIQDFAVDAEKQLAKEYPDIDWGGQP